MGIHHLMLFVKNWPAAKEYYTAALKPLGYELLVDWGTGGGFSVPGEKSGNLYVSQKENPTRSHIALIAPSIAALEEYHKVAIAAGGKDNGVPGSRSYLTGDNQACFVIDLDNNNIEVATVL